MIIIKQKGNFNKTDRFLKKASNLDYLNILNKYGREGVTALSSATPTDSGLTANSWSYSITANRGSFVISWNNSNVVNGIPIAILIQYGHATGNGGYVQGNNYINPAIKPIIDKIADEAWREVSKL